MLKNGFWTFLFAFIPGAGQMYQGYMRRGLSLMLITCGIFLAAFLLQPCIIFLMVVWMYSFFDALNLRSQIATGTAPEDEFLLRPDLLRGFEPLFRRRHKLVGWLLMALGALIAYQNVLMSILGDLVYRWGQTSAALRAVYLFMDDLPTIVSCIILIYCGVWLVRGPHGTTAEADYCDYQTGGADADDPHLSLPVIAQEENDGNE